MQGRRARFKGRTDRGTRHQRDTMDVRDSGGAGLDNIDSPLDLSDALTDTPHR